MNMKTSSFILASDLSRSFKSISILIR